MDAAEWPDSWKKVEFKEYPRMPKVSLPSPLPLTSTFQETLSRRASMRNFHTEKIISATQLSTLLYWSAGLNAERTGQKHLESSVRFYPSGGARYPLEVYLYFRGNADVNEGVYHYNVKEHCLEQLVAGPESGHAIRALPTYPWAYDAPLFFFISAVFDRSMRKYKERGYRFVAIEVGALLHNFYLVSAALGISCCAIGSAFDQHAETMLDLDGVKEGYINAFVVGFPA